MALTTEQTLARVRKIMKTGLVWKGDTDLLRDIMIGQLRKLEQDLEDPAESSP